MLLSDAIRKGCEVTRPYKGMMFDVDDAPRLRQIGAACALGAVSVALRGLAPAAHEGISPNTLAQVDYPCLNESVRVPDTAEFTEWLLYGPGDTAPLRQAIWSLNDYAGWSREAIAEWIDDLHARGVIDARHVSDLPAEEPAPSVPALDEAEALLS
jgi:hypothetical protein